MGHSNYFFKYIIVSEGNNMLMSEVNSKLLQGRDKRGNCSYSTSNLCADSNNFGLLQLFFLVQIIPQSYKTLRDKRR